MLREAFAFDWDAPLTADEAEAMLAKVADQIVRRGLSTPAVWMLEIHRPLIPIAGQGAIAFSPYIGTLFEGGAGDLQKYTKLMRDPRAIDRLIVLIEKQTEEADLAARIR